jgi:hypothetical protein
MTEEVIDTPADAGTSLESTNIVPKHEDVARESGWKPLEEWDGDPEDWVDAKEFNRRGEYMDRMKHQSSLIKKLEKKLSKQGQTLSELAAHHQKVKETEYKRALEELKLQKKEALEYMDHDRVIDIDDRIDDLKRVKESEKTTTVPEGTPPEVQEWIEDNPWYEEDVLLQGAAEALIKKEVSKNPEIEDLRGLLDKVTDRLKQEFPNKFGRKTRQTMPVAEPGNNEPSKTSKASKYSARNLNELELRVAKKFVALGAVKSVEEYAKQLAESNI